MKQFSAQYIFTNSGKPLKRGIITTDDEGVILDIEDTGGMTSERRAVKFYNGIIVPGFVNCHSHLELAHLKGSATKGTGLGDFIQQVRSNRESSYESIIDASEKADQELSKEGVVICADICNNDSSIAVKQKSRIKYINLLEVFGIDPAKAEKRVNEIIKVAEKFNILGLPYYIVPHAVYSTSAPLFRLIREKTSENKVTSLHFMETEGEIDFISSHKGSIAQSYFKSGLMPENPVTVRSHEDAVLSEITPAGNLILVHNTFADRSTVDRVNSRGNTFWCLCPGSNLYIENKLPDLNMLREAGCEIVIGTDSLASNDKLSILRELKILQDNFPDVSVEELIKWATINGAKALRENQRFGSIETGKRPGLLLLGDMDLINLRLLPGTTVSRLI
ncbi:MAG TPA: amidohydrolase family protein [Bacteroidales bacterium]|nr:amidohydrolase family protein [Bacteroidales bacterium]